MELIGGLIGAGLVAVAPMVPGLRPVAKALVKGGMAVAGVTVAVAAAVTEQVSDIMAHVRSQPESETIVEGETTPATTAATAAPETPVAGDPPATSPAGTDETLAGEASTASMVVPGMRPLAKATVKGGIALAEAAKGAVGLAVGTATMVGQQLGGLAAGLGRDTSVGETASLVEEVTAVEADSAGTDLAGSSAAAVTAVVETGAAGGADVTTAEASAAVGHESEAAASLSATTEGHAGPVSADDLLLIRGIGPKTASLLQAAGITTFAQLASTPIDHLRAILQQAGGRYRIIDPTSWPAQAQEILATPAQD